MNRKYITIIFLFVAGFIACSKQEVSENFKGFDKPANFPEPAYHFNTNPVTKAGFDLGKKLFFEPLLSANNTISCGSCHIPTAAFTHHGHSVSHGINDLLGTRNSPPIMNMAWNTSFMWDGGVADMDLQPIAPITNHVEMDETLENVLQKLRAHPQYPGMFKLAFGDAEINSQRFLKSMSQFMAMCVSYRSKYDSVNRMEGNAAFTDAETRGYNLFKQKCNSCHTEPLFTDQSFRNNGLPPSTIDDKGRYMITLQDNDKYKFKVPSLRNLMYSAPYMHDGRLFSLDAVLNHYTTGVQSTPNLDPLLTQGTTNGLSMSAAEKQDLLAFLQTLNDRNFVTDPLLAE